MKKFLLTVLFLIMVILGGLGFFIVRSFNAENFQKQIVKSMSDITGREFNVMGTTYVTWLPSPEIILNDVTLSNAKGSTRAVMLSIERVSIQLTWKSLLKNPLVIDKIKLENPVVYLERNDANNVNWNFSFLDKRVIEKSTLGVEDNFIQTRVDNLEVKNGALNYINAITNAKVELSAINGRIILDTLQGPYSFKGAIQKGDTVFDTDLSIKQLVSDVEVPFTLVMNAKDKSLFLDLNGEILTKLKGLNLSANGSFMVQKPNDLLKELGLFSLSETLNVPAQGGLTYTSQNGLDSLKNFTIRFGDNEDSIALTGSASREEKDGSLFYTIAFAINQLNYDQWADIIQRLKKADLNDKQLPNFDLKLNAQKITYQKSEIKEASLALSKKDGRLLVHSLKALFPGETEVSASGGSLIQDDKFGVSLLVDLKSKNFKQLLSGYFDTNTIASNVLTTAQADMNLLIFSDMIDVEVQSFETGSSSLVGHAQILKTKKPTIHFDGTLKNVNFDQYIGYKPAKTKMNLTEVIPAIKEYFKTADSLTKFNSKFDVELKDVTLKQLPISYGKLSGSLDEGKLKLSEFRATGVAMATLLAAGEVENIATDNLKINNMRVDFNTTELKLFLDRANLLSTNQFLNQTNTLTTSLQTAENKDIWSGTMRSKIGELETYYSGSIDLSKNKAEAKDLLVEVTYPSFQQFLKKVLMTKKINNSVEGAFSFKGTLNGSFDQFRLSGADVKIGTNYLSMDADVKNTESQKSIDLKVKTPSFDLNRYMLNDFRNVFADGSLGDTTFNFSLLDLWQVKLQLDTGQILWQTEELKNALVKLSIQDKQLVVENLTGVPSVPDSLLKVSGQLSWAGVPQLKANIDLVGYALGANLITGDKTSFGNGILTLSGNIATTGKSPNEMRKKLSGSGKLNISNALWVGADIQKVPLLIDKTIKDRSPKHVFDTELNRYLNSGKTTFESLSGNFTIEKGIFKMMDASLKAEIFYSNPMQIVYNIPQKSIDVSVPISLATYADMPPFAISLKGNSFSPQYLTNFVDLSNAVDDIVQQGNTKIAEQLQKEKEKLAKITLTERAERIKQAIHDAREAVKIADEKLFAGDNESASFLLQNAKDALAIVNQLSVKETLTDAQYIQLMEQSRMAILKAKEAIDETVRDLYFEDRKQVQTFVKQSQEMLSQIEMVNETNPEIEIVAKLLVLVKQYAQVLKLTNEQFSNDISQDDHLALMQTARDAFSKIVHAYEYIARFEPEGTERIQPISINRVQNKADIVVQEQQPEPVLEKAPSFKGQIIRM